MSYKVLALKYRPQNFEDVVGQEHVTKTLSNAISSNRVAHAILLTGPRGTGKTTIARIMAKAMNCEQGPTPTPCNICKSCKSITNGSSSDVFEIDGASNNSVDQIRELRANVTYMPTASRLKIYIIDEVHMLSTAAFNALLKTLEEPPDHVMFMFATTESHKIPITILSRCQRHDLGRVKLAQISLHLQKLCTKESFIISNESIDLVASEADGSIRDSLSLLDRILSSSQTKEISHESIINNLGIIDKKIIFDLSEFILRRDIFGVLTIIERVNDLGLDLKKFYTSVVKHFRNIAVIRACSNSQSIVDITESDRDVIKNMISNYSIVYLTQLLNIFLKEEQLIKSASNTRIALETVMLKIIHARPAFEIDELIKKFDKAAEKFKNIPENRAGENNGFQELNREQILNREQTDRINKSDISINIKQDVISEAAAPFRQDLALSSQTNTQTEKRDYREIVNKDNHEADNKEIKKKIVIKDGSEPSSMSAAQQLSHQEEEQLRRDAMSHPLVNYAKKIFSSSFVDVKIVKAG